MKGSGDTGVWKGYNGVAPTASALCVAILLAVLAGCARTPEAREAQHLKRGTAALAKKDYRTAALEFQIASQNMPKDAEPVYQMAMTFLKAGASEAAYESFRKAEGLNPRHEGARYQTALFQVGSDKPELVEKARTTILEYLGKHPEDTAGRGALALAEAKLGDKEEAIRQLGATVEKEPSNMRPVASILAYYAARGDIETVKRIVRTLTDWAPRSPEAAAVRAEVGMATRDTADADEEIARALKLKPDSQPALVLRLRRDRKTGDSADAYTASRELSRVPEKRMWSAYARLLFTDKKTDEGKAEFERVLKEHPGDVELRDEYSGMLLELGLRKEAGDVLKETLAKSPRDHRALLQRIALETDLGNLDGASKDVKTLTDLKAFSAELSYRQAHIFAARGDRIQQAQLLTGALKYNPRFLEARLELAQALVDAGNAKKAVDVLEQASQVERSVLQYIAMHATALIAAGNDAGARRDVDIGLANGRTAGFLYQDAVLKARNKDTAGARKSLEEGFAVTPSYMPLTAMLGRMMSGQGEPAKFLAMVKGAAEKNAGSPALQLELGSLLEAKGDTAGARAAFEAAGKDGDTPDADFELARLDMKSAPDRAKQRLLELAKTRDSPRVRIALANIEEQKGSPPEVIIPHYLRAIQLDPANVLAMNNLAGLLAQQNKPDESLFWAQKALALEPDSPVLADTVGWIYYRRKKYDLALPFLVRSLKGMDRPVAHYHLAAVLAATGDPGRGRSEYDIAVKRDPGSAARAMVAPLFEKEGSR